MISKTIQTLDFPVLAPAYSVQEKFDLMTGFELGFMYQKSISSKWLIETGLEFNSIRYRRSSEVVSESDLNGETSDRPFVIDGNSFGNVLFLFEGNQPVYEATSNLGKTRLQQVSVPVNIFYNIGRFGIGAGVRMSYLLLSKETINQLEFSTSPLIDLNEDGVIDFLDSVIAGNSFEVVEIEDKSGEGLNSLGLQGVVHLRYQIGDKLGIYGSMMQGFNSVYNQSKTYSNKVRLRSVSFGLDFSI